MKKFIAIAIIIFGLSVLGFIQKESKVSHQAINWQIDDFKQIGGNSVTVVGNPRLIDGPSGKATEFDGAGDALIVNSNPVAGAQNFTIEAAFRPDANGSKEQRWFHIQQADEDNRILLETRLIGNEWFLDTFIKSGEHSHALYAENFKHPVGHWYHIALVFDGSEMRHYVNGKLEMSNPLSIAPLGAGQTSLGVRINRVYWFKGAISKARFTDRALSPGEFMEHK